MVSHWPRHQGDGRLRETWRGDRHTAFEFGSVQRIWHKHRLQPHDRRKEPNPGARSHPARLARKGPLPPDTLLFALWLAWPVSHDAQFWRYHATRLRNWAPQRTMRPITRRDGHTS